MCAWYVHVFSERVEGVHTLISKLKPDLQASLRVFVPIPTPVFILPPVKLS